MSVLRNTPFGTENIFRETCLFSVSLVAYDPYWAWLYFGHFCIDCKFEVYFVGGRPTSKIILNPLLTLLETKSR